MMSGYGYGMSGGFGFGGVFMILLWLLIIVGIVWLVKWLSHTDEPHDMDSAMSVLRERYARGEIDEQEFQQRKQELMR